MRLSDWLRLELDPRVWVPFALFAFTVIGKWISDSWKAEALAKRTDAYFRSALDQLEHSCEHQVLHVDDFVKIIERPDLETLTNVKQDSGAVLKLFGAMDYRDLYVEQHSRTALQFMRMIKSVNSIEAHFDSWKKAVSQFFELNEKAREKLNTAFAGLQNLYNETGHIHSAHGLTGNDLLLFEAMKRSVGAYNKAADENSLLAKGNLFSNLRRSIGEVNKPLSPSMDRLREIALDGVVAYADFENSRIVTKGIMVRLRGHFVHAANQIRLYRTLRNQTRWPALWRNGWLAPAWKPSDGAHKVNISPS